MGADVGSTASQLTDKAFAQAILASTQTNPGRLQPDKLPDISTWTSRPYRARMSHRSLQVNIPRPTGAFCLTCGSAATCMSARYHGRGADQAHTRLTEQLRPSAVVLQQNHSQQKHTCSWKAVDTNFDSGRKFGILPIVHETAFSIARGVQPWHVPLRAIWNEQNQLYCQCR